MPKLPHLAQAQDFLKRRPCFWAALAAGGAIGNAAAHPDHPLLWLALLGLTCACLRTPFRWFAGVLAIGALAGWLTACRLAPPAHAMREGEPVTVRATITRILGQQDGQTRAVVHVRARLESGRWLATDVSYGVTLPESASFGDLVELSGRLHVPTPARNAGAPDSRLDLLRRGAVAQLVLRPLGYRRLAAAPRASWRAWSDALRRRILALDRKSLTAPQAVVVNSLLIGDSDPPDAELAGNVRGMFRESGTIQLLVVSGAQVALVLGFFVALGWRLRRWRFLFWIAGLAALGGFYLLTRGDPTVSRAALVAVVALAALATNRETDPENSLGFAAILLMLWNPLILFDLGFQLALAAVWALYRLSRPIEQLIGPPERSDLELELPEKPARELWRRLAAVVAPCIAVHLGIAPVLAWRAQATVWGAIPANLISAPIAALLLILAVPHLLLAACGLPILARVVGLFADAMYGWAGLFSRPPLGAGHVFPLPYWLALLLLGLLALPALAKWSRLRTLLLVVFLTATLLASDRWPSRPPGAPLLRAIDVGQGDAILLQGSDGTNLLVDSGPPDLATFPPRSTVATTLRALRVPFLDAVVVSHPHADHIGGLPELLEEIPVGTLLHGPAHEEVPEWQAVVEAAGRHGVTLADVRAGEELQIRSSRLSFLGPVHEGARRGRLDLNEESVVFRWEQAGVRFLLPGDTNARAEGELLRSGVDLRADVLKVAHHGSRTATSEALLKRVHPACAVISCGRDNRFGHPAPSTLEHLVRAGIPVYRTDRQGMLTISDDHGRIRAETYLSP